jgi:hypothetical protein
MPKFENGKIYKIIGNGLTYIGSTTEPIKKRLNRHLDYIKQGRYCSSSKVLSGTDYKIELIEDFPCENNSQLTEREYYWFSIIDNCNDISPKQQYVNKYQTYVKNNTSAYNATLIASQKWKQANKEKIKDYNQKYKQGLKSKKHLAFVASNTIDECIACGSAYDL